MKMKQLYIIKKTKLSTVVTPKKNCGKQYINMLYKYEILIELYLGKESHLNW